MSGNLIYSVVLRLDPSKNVVARKVVEKVLGRTIARWILDPYFGNDKINAIEKVVSLKRSDICCFTNIFLKCIASRKIQQLLGLTSYGVQSTYGI